ncbi:MAG: hypothetical protein AB1486_03080 [Planctomycetota bacterium]
MKVGREGVPAGSDGVDMVIPDVGALRYRLIDAPRMFILSWRRSGEQRLSLLNRDETPDAHGWYEDVFPTGRIDVSVATYDDRRQPAVISGVSISSGQETAIEIRLQEGYVLDVQLADTSPLFPSDHQLVLVREDEDPEDLFATRNETRCWGRFLNLRSLRSGRFKQLATGKYRLLSIPNDLQIEPSAVAVTGGATTPIQVRWFCRRDR